MAIATTQNTLAHMHAVVRTLNCYFNHGSLRVTCRTRTLASVHVVAIQKQSFYVYMFEKIKSIIGDVS